MDCFGSFDPYKCTVQNCEFYHSCRYYTADTKNEFHRERILQKLKVDPICRTEEFRDNLLGTVDFDFDFDTFTESNTYTYDQVISLIAYILRLKKDSTIWRILQDRISGRKRALAAYAREEGITRQALHKRIGKVIARMLEYKIRKIPTDSRLIKLTPREFHLYKLQQIYDDRETIAIELNLTSRSLEKLEAELETKLFRYT